MSSPNILSWPNILHNHITTTIAFFQPTAYEFHKKNIDTIPFTIKISLLSVYPPQILSATHIVRPNILQSQYFTQLFHHKIYILPTFNHEKYATNFFTTTNINSIHLTKANIPLSFLMTNIVHNIYRPQPI